MRLTLEEVMQGICDVEENCSVSSDWDDRWRATIGGTRYSNFLQQRTVVFSKGPWARYKKQVSGSTSVRLCTTQATPSASASALRALRARQVGLCSPFGQVPMLLP